MLYQDLYIFFSIIGRITDVHEVVLATGLASGFEIYVGNDLDGLIPL